MITLSALNDFNRIRHGFFTREGGVSQGLYGSLNCGPGSKDDPAAVRENRGRAMAMMDLPVESLATLYQAHTADVVVVTEAWPAGQSPTADAMVTNRPGIALGILTADCAPVLLADGKGGVVAAAHAGWKGALGGVLDNTVKAMVELGGKTANMVAAIGPCIGHRSYEVGPEFPDPFLAEDAHNIDFFAPSSRPGNLPSPSPGKTAGAMRSISRRLFSASNCSGRCGKTAPCSRAGLGGATKPPTSRGPIMSCGCPPR